MWHQIKGGVSQTQFSIIVPAHNEEKRIARCLQILIRIYPTAQIIVSEDGSTDRTVDIVREYPVTVCHSDIRLGKWGGVKEGLQYSNQPYSVIIDADLSVSPYMFLAGIDLLDQGYDVVLGKRVAVTNGPLYRKVLGRGFHFLVRLLFNLPYDTQTSFMAVRTEIANNVLSELDVSGYASSVKFVYICKRRHLRITQLPVIWEYFPESSMKFPRDIVLMLKDLVAQRLEFWRKDWFQVK